MGIKIKDTAIWYNNKPVISDLNLELDSGKIIVILGENGAGKSTLLKSLVKINPVKKGEILIDDRNISTLKQKELARLVSFLPQKPLVPEAITVKTLVAQGRYPHQQFLKGQSKRDLEIINWALKASGVDHYRHHLISTLSGGELQRAWIAMVIAQKTKYILLDEPTTYLDINHQLQVLDLLKEINQKYKTTIIMTLHDLNLASKYADEIIALKAGKVLFKGSPKNFMTAENINNLYGVKPQICDLGSHLVCTDFTKGEM